MRQEFLDKNIKPIALKPCAIFRNARNNIDPFSVVALIKDKQINTRFHNITWYRIYPSIYCFWNTQRRFEVQRYAPMFEDKIVLLVLLLLNLTYASETCHCQGHRNSIHTCQ